MPNLHLVHPRAQPIELNKLTTNRLPYGGACRALRGRARRERWCGDNAQIGVEASETSTRRVYALVSAQFPVAEDTRFELVRVCTQPAFQASAIGP